MKTKLLLASIVLASICGTASAARCVVPFIRTLDNQTVIGTIFTSTGSPCHIGLARSRGPMSSVQLLENAKNGTVRVSGGSIFYVSRSNFVGEDHFTYARHGMNDVNQPVVRTVAITVQVAAP